MERRNPKEIQRDTANVLAILFKGNVSRPLSTLITSFNYNFLPLLITLAARLFWISLSFSAAIISLKIITGQFLAATRLLLNHC